MCFPATLPGPNAGAQALNEQRRLFENGGQLEIDLGGSAQNFEQHLYPLARREDWRLRDPKGLVLSDVRAIRDEIRGLVTQLIQRKGWGRNGHARPQLVPADLS